ncbi:MAG TPA: addiction module protein [Burkholderiales bacterium]|jgi:putative addiction module component (TIGR02574 family)|nr:addiction module protein [Burkholderiales bacterium]
MPTPIEDLEAQALKLLPHERDELIHRLIVSLEGEPEDTPEAIAQAWDEEISRRVAEMEAGHTTSIPGEQVFAEIRALIQNHRKG